MTRFAVFTIACCALIVATGAVATWSFGNALALAGAVGILSGLGKWLPDFNCKQG